MKLAGRMQAAIEVLDDIAARRRPAQDALKDWGLAHRFAGSKDRAAIGNLVHDALRRQASIAWRMDADTARALVLGTVVLSWDHTLDDLDQAFAADRHAPPPLDDTERRALSGSSLKGAADWIKADIPGWAADHLQANFDDAWIKEGAALAGRPPLDIRVNTLKAAQAKVQKSLARYKARPCAIAEHGLRIAARQGPERLPNVQAEAGFQKGWFEIQDEGSQVVSRLVYARPGEQVLDYCAGGGGKTLAMAADMENKGQIHAFDADRLRLAPIHERLKRAGTRNVQVLDAATVPPPDLQARMDRVLVDAPCTGSGTWRRRPDAKWRLSESAIDDRVAEQTAILNAASAFVRPGGFLAYVTCSLFPAENEDRVYDFLERNPDFEIVSAGEVWQEVYGFDKPQPWSADMMSITLTPASTETDGFYFAVMERAGT